MEVQRYPEDFDGIIAGDPATGTPMQVGRALVYQYILASPDQYLPSEKVELLSNATLAACDATDGLKDGLIHRRRISGVSDAGPKRPGLRTRAELAPPRADQVGPYLLSYGRLM